MKPRSLLSFVLGSRQETCEGCQQAFSCGSLLRGCWCRDVKVSGATHDRLRAQYQGCVCRACLEKAEAELERAGETGVT
jgi:hypothetical protein